jgi:hypothetical protein
MRTVLLVVTLAALAACGDEKKNLSGVDKVAPPGGATAPAAPMGDPHGGNPHAGPGAIPNVKAGPAPVAWSVPAGWKVTPPSSGMRVAQFDVGVDETGDAVQCIVFGGNMGPDDENIKRWVGQMGPAAKDSAVVASSEHDGVKITRLEAGGSYTDTMRASEPKTVATAKMLAAIVESPSGKLYVKLAGPKTVVDGAAKAFDEFLASMKPK